jgi:cellobiose phosphorylase
MQMKPGNVQTRINLSEIEEHWTVKSFHINFSVISYRKSFICNKHVTKSILFDKTLDNRLSLADKSFIKLGLSKKSMIFMLLMFAITRYLCIVLTITGHLGLLFVYENFMVSVDATTV